MIRHDPQLPLRCPRCGAPLRYGASTDSGTAHEPSEIFQRGADIHHYACTGIDCARFWKFGPGTGLMEDLLQVAARPQSAH